MTVNSGSGLLSSVTYLGNTSAATGTVTVDGGGSTWTAGGLYVGVSGSGTLNVTGGSTVNSVGGQIADFPGSVGVVNVDGAGSKWNGSSGGWESGIWVGGEAAGSLKITNGGAVACYLIGEVGEFTSDLGSPPVSTMSVDGAGSTWTDYNGLTVGASGGSGTLTITNGAVATSCTIGASSSYWSAIGEGSSPTSTSKGVATVDGPGSKWVDGSMLYVGLNADGALFVTGGAAASDTFAYLGYNSTAAPGMQGTAAVDGPDRNGPIARPSAWARA